MNRRRSGILLTTLFVTVPLIAPAVAVAPQEQRPALPLAIAQVWIDRTAPQPSGLVLTRVEVLNTGKRTILAWGVRFAVKRPDGTIESDQLFSLDAGSNPPRERTA